MARFTCVIRYTVEPDRMDELRAYAHSWIALIRKYGGEHHGYFVPPTDEERAGQSPAGGPTAIRAGGLSAERAPTGGACRRR